MEQEPSMRFAIFGDVHANLEALQAVLADAEAQKATHHVCLGDLVGYNANPHECVDVVRKLECPVVKGNYDEYASLTDHLDGLNPRAQKAIIWTRQHLTDDDKTWLRALPLAYQVEAFTIVHATLDTPHKWGYVFNELDAAASFTYQRTDICFFGHTHAPRAYIRDRGVSSQALDKLTVASGKQYFINCGSVGQPRDGDWRAVYCLYTPGQQLVELRRIEYDISAAQEKRRDIDL
jgi:predicted phosphodiesterase